MSETSKNNHEKESNDNLETLSSQECQKLSELSKSICRIKCNDKSKGTGFFCKLNFGDTILYELITNNHIINNNNLKIGSRINVLINNEDKNYEIEIDNNRRTYTNENYNITIIEIRENDGIKNDSFLEFDENIYEPNHSFINQSIFLLQYPKSEENSFSKGLISSVDENNGYIEYVCQRNLGSSGGPLINTNLKVIGIQKQTLNKFNYGNLLNVPIREFKEILKKNIYNKGEQKKDNFNKELIGNEQDSDEIILKYDIDKPKKIRLFGDEFVENNRDNCKIIYDKEEYNLTTHFNVDNNQIKDDIFEIRLKGIKNITNMSHMFAGKSDDFVPLSSLSDISEWNTLNVINMSHIFSNCISLSSLTDISKWNTENVTNMSYMFNECKSLSKLSDISKWNTKNITDMSFMFYNCLSLSSIPDISELNTENVVKMNSMFSGCESLSSLPDLSKWNANNVTNMNSMFYNCKSLLSLSDISKWNTLNVINMGYMFSNCSSLSKLPDISGWNTSKVTDMNSMFYNCSSLSSLPDLSKWNTHNVTNMSYMFNKCKSLSELPDLSKWNTENVTNMSYMFNQCKSLSLLPDISQWNTQNVTKMSYMFNLCSSLSSLPDISKWNIQKVTDMNKMFNGHNKKLKIPIKFE